MRIPRCPLPVAGGARLVLATWLCLVVTAGPAVAHGRASDATNFSSRIVRAPDVAGVSWRIYGGDEYLAVRNDSGQELTVEGYEGEPYLRIGPDGVFVNDASKATYQNADRYAEVATLPPDVGPDQEPRWRRVSDAPTYAWHDHRIHWMSRNLPPGVVDPQRETKVLDWEVPFTIDGRRERLVGQLVWVPGRPPWPLLAVALLLTAPGALGLVALRGRQQEPGWVPRLARPAAVVLGVVGLANLSHLADDLFAVPQPGPSKALAAAQTTLFIGMGLFGALRGWQGRDGAFTALGVGAAALFVGQGLLYAGVLTASQAASLAPDTVARGIVALSWAQVLPVGAVAVAGNRRLTVEAADGSSHGPRSGDPLGAGQTSDV